MTKKEKYIVDILEQSLPYSERYALRNVYYHSGCSKTKRSNPTRNKYIDICIVYMRANELDSESMQRLLKFASVVIDSNQYQLSILKAYEDLRINDILGGN